MSAAPQNKHVSCFRAVGGNTKLLCTAPQASVIAYLSEPDCASQYVFFHVCACLCARVCVREFVSLIPLAHCTINVDNSCCNYLYAVATATTTDTLLH